MCVYRYDSIDISTCLSLSIHFSCDESHPISAFSNRSSGGPIDPHGRLHSLRVRSPMCIRGKLWIP